ncbi:glycosyltransferase family 39 protein [Edaphobacter albus]|uniref:glycosyltransferase family 39 protein n=1 Tax=Edaphobacter sp. 4G125 TaxID=2763071 RepID=UPI001647A688|nr:glycosyltransferase family 39 protein [Edaphobacter sp. 4G125]QNI37125.1 hypothetical protein H7846_01980 [Edaphobacter sp. 4G125]
MGFTVVFDPPRQSSAVRRALDTFAEFANHRPAILFAIFSAAYFLVVSALSHNKVLWLDELITLHIAQLGSAKAIWNALAHAADPNPPLTHLAVLASLRLFGDYEFALRLPAILGYWIGLLSLFIFLRRHIPTVWALAGVLLSMSNAAFDYSYESRSYGIFYGLAMLAVLCWSVTIDPYISQPRRRFVLLGMTAALAAGICTNYFAVLAFFPIAGGELVRTFRLSGSRPRIDVRIWTALAVAATPLLVFRGLIQRSIEQFAPHAWNKVSFDQVADSYLEMVEVILIPVVVLIALVALVWMLSRMCSHCRGRLRPRWLANLADEHVYCSGLLLPLHEAVAVLLLMLYPFLGYLVASIHGGMLSPRFVIPVCFGFAISGAIAGYHLFGHLRYAGMIAFGLCAAVFLGRVFFVGWSYHEQKQCFYQVLNSLPGAAGDKPIAVADPLMALPLAHYAPPAIASRMVFPVDFPAIRFFRGEDSPEENLWAGRNLYHLSIVPLADFQKNVADYLILASDGNWLVRDLWNHRYPVRRLPVAFPAKAIGGFTPLDHGDPALFVAAGDRSSQNRLHSLPIPFHVPANLPGAPALKPSDTLR